MEIACPTCGEADDLSGVRAGDVIEMTCRRCGHEWRRDLAPRCPQCGGDSLRTVPLAILEKGRGTQLSVVGTRPVRLCVRCDAAALERWQRNRPNPLMPGELPTGD
jgi:hypothetical protein